MLHRHAGFRFTDQSFGRRIVKTSSWLVVTSVAVALVGCARETESARPSDVSKAHQAAVSASKEQEQRQLITPADAEIELVDPPKLLSEEQLRDGWITLFDGETLFGWTANSDAAWNVKDGEVISSGGAPGLLLTTTRFQDYELACDVWLEPGGNSGVFLRSVAYPQSPAKDCLEFNLCDSHDSFPTGSLVGREKTSQPVRIEGEWHQVKIRLNGDTFEAEIDGQSVFQMTSQELLATGGGHIGLQQNGGEVRFRNVFLRPLNLEPLMDGESLSGWRKTPGSDAEITVSNGEVHLLGAGYLESRDRFDNFVLQFDAKLNQVDVNSGLFFRTEEGTEAAPSNGYELQLQNTIAENDRRKPADYGDGFGTGAIFRRQKARYVNADDQKWFSVTLIADGNHFSSWVNGLQVTDFADERKIDPNPRQGRRDEAGHLSFQGHDQLTDASFRQVRLKELTFE